MTTWASRYRLRLSGPVGPVDCKCSGNLACITLLTVSCTHRKSKICKRLQGRWEGELFVYFILFSCRVLQNTIWTKPLCIQTKREDFVGVERQSTWGLILPLNFLFPDLFIYFTFFRDDGGGAHEYTLWCACGSQKTICGSCFSSVVVGARDQTQAWWQGPLYAEPSCSFWY